MSMHNYHQNMNEQKPGMWRELKYKAKIYLPAITIGLAALIGLERCSERNTNQTKQELEHAFKIEIQKSSNEKYYIKNPLTWNTFDEGSIREFYFNIDGDSSTVEQYIKFEAIPNTNMWKPAINLVRDGFQEIYKHPALEAITMTKEQEHTLDKKFQEELKLWEPISIQNYLK